jgi:hypothetical protein
MIDSYYTANGHFTLRQPVTEIMERVRPRYFSVANQSALARNTAAPVAAQAGGAR